MLPSASNNRLGFHYFPDTLHYRENDLVTWLPELQALGAGWLTLPAPLNRAIPEAFIRGLKTAGIQPILHFNIPTSATPPIRDMIPLFEAYAHWGAQYAILYDRPNTRQAWTPASWAQNNLVERFLDLYIPPAEALVHSGLIPVFPPLEPGGDYWDTAFLQAALQGMQRRGQTHLLEKLALSAYAWTRNRPLNWGAGGPERWPGAHPYHTQSGSEDQLGFRIFDWYLTLARAVLGKTCPILLAGAGALPGDQQDSAYPTVDPILHSEMNLTIAKLLHSCEQPDCQTSLEPIPPEVLACNFWLLACPAANPSAQQAWFGPDGKNLPAVDMLRNWAAMHSNSKPPDPAPVSTAKAGKPTGPTDRRAIGHYLLLPTYEWGVSDWHLEVIRPYVKKHRPTIGFSIEEACGARRVTLIGGTQTFPEDVVVQLASAGCLVERIEGTGTEIAMNLANL